MIPISITLKLLPNKSGNFHQKIYLEKQSRHKQLKFFSFSSQNEILSNREGYEITQVEETARSHLIETPMWPFIIRGKFFALFLKGH